MVEEAFQKTCQVAHRSVAQGPFNPGHVQLAAGPNLLPNQVKGGFRLMLPGDVDRCFFFWRPDPETWPPPP